MTLDLSKTATALLKSLGDETYVKITRDTGGVFDPVLGETTGATTSVLNVVGAVTKIKASLVGNQLTSGERIKETDKMILLDNGITPLMSDEITFSGIDHKVVQIDEINHAGVTQLWKVIVRG